MFFLHINNFCECKFWPSPSLMYSAFSFKAVQMVQQKVISFRCTCYTTVCTVVSWPSAHSWVSAQVTVLPRRMDSTHSRVSVHTSCTWKIQQVPIFKITCKNSAVHVKLCVLQSIKTKNRTPQTRSHFRRPTIVAIDRGALTAEQRELQVCHQHTTKRPRITSVFVLPHTIAQATRMLNRCHIHTIDSAQFNFYTW